MLALTGRAEGPPLVPPGRAATVAAKLADRFAAVTGVQVAGAQILAERAAYTGHRRRGAVSVGGACRLLPTADGWAAVSCARPDDPALLGALVGEDAGDDPWPALTRWLREHTGAELAQRAELLSIAAAPIILAAPFTLVAPITPIPLITPIAPIAVAAPVVRGGPTRPLAGRLVADFSALSAGPLCAHLLGLAGARVVKVETPGRPDGARSGNTAFYRLLHAGHRSVTLDPRTSGGRAEMAALVRAADIVIESSRPRALARFGLDAAGTAAAGTTWVSITAYGRASDRVGNDVAAGAGLVARDADGLPVFAGDAIADPLTGLTAAAAVACAPAGGALLDIAMSDVVAATLDPALPDPASSSAKPSLAARRDGDGWLVEGAGGAVPVAPPQKVSRARR